MGGFGSNALPIPVPVQSASQDRATEMHSEIVLPDLEYAPGRTERGACNRARTAADAWQADGGRVHLSDAGECCWECCRGSESFDPATSVMVLQLAMSPEELAAFFRSASRHLGSGGRFISVLLNPSFSAFGRDFFVRPWTRLERNNMRSVFLDRASGRVETTVEGHQYTSEEFERAAISGGMKPAAWRKLFATPDAVRQMGASFWQPCHEHQPYALFVTQKE
jgi:hypothetical protein